MGGAIAPHRLEFDEDASVGTELDAVLGERGAEEVAEKRRPLSAVTVDHRSGLRPGERPIARDPLPAARFAHVFSVRNLFHLDRKGCPGNY